MLSTSKTRLNYRPIIATIGITLVLWILSKGRIAGKMKVTENEQSKEVNFTT